MGDRVEQQLGNYRLIRSLGQGSFAQVYLGEHIRLKSYAALKVLHTFLSEEDRNDFLSEARTLVRLKHQHIIRLLDFDVENGIPFLVMEYAPGGTLRKLHPKGSRVPLSDVVAYVQQVAAALEYAHALSVVHRDIKPENMLRGAQGEVLLSDFGIATIAHATRSMQTDRQQAGTLPYMAPEQLQKHPRPASDQYALAVVAYEWLCGERPFAGSEWTLMYQHLHTPPPPLLEKIPDLPRGVEDVILRALAKDPHERFGDVRTFAEALTEAAGLSHISFSIPPLIAPALTPRIFAEAQQVGDFSTCAQEQSPARPVALLQPSNSAPETPDPPQQQPEFSHSSEALMASQPRQASWLQGTWTQRLILLLLALSLIAASVDITFTLASWQHAPIDTIDTTHLDSQDLAHKREMQYTSITNRKPDDVFLRKQQDSATWTSNANCYLDNAGYHVIEAGQDRTRDCVGQMTHYEDFAFQVGMTILRGDEGGLTFRAYFNPRQLYHFHITTYGTYALTVDPGVDGPSGKSTAIKTGPHQENILAVIARGEQILLYINGHYVNQMRDRQSLSGSIGVFAVHNRGSPPANVIFHNAKVWVLQ